MTQPAALLRGKLVLELSKLSSQALGLQRHALEASQQQFGLREIGPGLGELLEQTHRAPRIGEKAFASLFTRLLPGAIESLDLATRELMPHDGPRHLLTGTAVDPGQGNERFHRRLGGDLTRADRLLDRERQLAHQSQTPRHPTRAAHEAMGQFLLPPAETMLQLGEQPALLQGARGPRLTHLPMQQQSLWLGHLPHQGLDRVMPQATEHLDAPVAIDDHIAIRLLRLRHHHDRLLLTVLLDRHQEPTLALAAARAQLRVAHLQLVKLQLHDRLQAGSLGQQPNARPSRSLKPALCAFSHTVSLSTS